MVLFQWHDVGAQVVPDLHYDLSQLGGQSDSITVKVVQIKGNGERKETSICFLYIIIIVCILTVNVMFGEVHNNYCEWKEKQAFSRMLHPISYTDYIYQILNQIGAHNTTAKS